MHGCRRLWGEGRRMGLGGRDRSAMIEWWSGLDGPNGLILLLFLMTLWPYDFMSTCSSFLNNWHYIHCGSLGTRLDRVPLRETESRERTWPCSGTDRWKMRAAPLCQAGPATPPGQRAFMLSCILDFENDGKNLVTLVKWLSLYALYLIWDWPYV